MAAQDKPHSSADAAARMRTAAERLLAAVPEHERTKAQRPFSDRDRGAWHYTPRSRNGVALKELDAGGRFFKTRGLAQASSCAVA